MRAEMQKRSALGSLASGLALSVAMATPVLTLGQGADPAAARAIVAARADAVVVVLATVKMRVNIGGREQTVDQAAQANATVLDGTGLAVMSLQQIQPDEALSRSYSRQAPGTHVEITSDVSDIRMHLADGRELPAKLILRDEDLDLAFVRPTDPPPSPLAAVDATSARPQLLDPLTLIRRTTETNGWLPAATTASVELIVDKPRTYYQIAILGSASPGGPVFDMSGRFVGVLVLRDTGTRTGAALAVLPADDIREVAKQAPPR